jgi:endonuclease YncB( thermonuclease family)
VAHRSKAPRSGAFFRFRPRFDRARILLICILALLAPPAAGSETATVRHVLDGDTVILTDERHVRLIGINAPERGRDGAPDQPLAAAARERLRALAEGRPVTLSFETERRDRYGRWLAHLALADGRSVAPLLIKEGLAFTVAVPPNVRELASLEAAEAEARRARRGVWGRTEYAPVAAAALTGASGFRLVHGRVSRVGRSRKFVYLDLGPRFAVRVEHDHWRHYFREPPEAWRGRELVARGWISEYDGRLYLGIGHPAMLERRP